jgi:hypothetical protein
MAGWQADLASALAARGRYVRATPQGITVTCPGSGCVPRTE